MAGHSHASNVRHKKNAVDAKRAKVFTKIARNISIAVKQGGTDIELNPKLKTLLEYARSMNFPKENIQRAIQKSSENANQEELKYECFIDQAAVIILAYSDNRNRVATEIRSVLKKVNGSLGQCEFMFEHIVKLTYNYSDILEEEAMMCDILDIHKEDETLILECSPDKAVDVEKTLGAAVDKQSEYRPYNTISLNTDHAIWNAINALEELDEVEDVYHNAVCDA